MKLKTWTKGVLTLFALLFLCAWAFQLDAWARAGGGSSGRGLHGQPRLPDHDGPQTLHRAHDATTSPTRPSTAPGATAPQPAPSSGSFMRSFGGGLLGGLAGGMLFHSLFGGPSAQGGAGATGGGGIGLMDILLLAGIGYLIYWYIKKKRREADATAGYYQSSGNVDPAAPASVPTGL